MKVYLLKVRLSYRFCDEEDCDYSDHNSNETLFRGVYSNKEKAKEIGEMIKKNYDIREYFGRRKIPADADKPIDIYSIIRTFTLDEEYSEAKESPFILGKEII
jgi:hypothetical protein